MPHSDRTTLSKVPHDSYRHEAFLWSGEDDFLAGTAPFIREGLRAGQPVMVAVTAPHIWLLRTALGTDADRVRFVDMAVVGRNPARIIPAWREFVPRTQPTASLCAASVSRSGRAADQKRSWSASCTRRCSPSRSNSASPCGCYAPTTPRS